MPAQRPGTLPEAATLHCAGRSHLDHDDRKCSVYQTGRPREEAPSPSKSYYGPARTRTPQGRHPCAGQESVTPVKAASNGRRG